MKTITEKFEEVRQANPAWSDIVCFVEVVKTRRYTRDEIVSVFENLVPFGDYAGSGKTKETMAESMAEMARTTPRHSPTTACKGLNLASNGKGGRDTQGGKKGGVK